MLHLPLTSSTGPSTRQTSLLSAALPLLCITAAKRGLEVILTQDPETACNSIVLNQEHKRI